MAKWKVCNHVMGYKILINFDTVTLIWPIPEGCRIYEAGRDAQYWDVLETFDEISEWLSK